MKAVDKRVTDPLQIVATSVEGFLIFINSMGLFFFISRLNLEGTLLKIIPGLFIMLQVPVTFLLVPFFFYSITFLLYKHFVRRSISALDKKMMTIHFIYGAFYCVLILFWLLKIVGVNTL